MITTATDEQQEQFGLARDGEGFTEQFVLLRIRHTSDCRAWDWNTVLDEPDVTLVGWEGMDVPDSIGDQG